MVMTESITHFRVSRSLATRRSAIRRILNSDRDVRRQLGQVPAGSERRREVRRSLRVPVYFRPVQVRGLSVMVNAASPTYLAVTQNISLRGLGWIHDAPLPPAKYLVEFDISGGAPLQLLLEVCWTVQEDEFAFRSGGRILGICRRG